MVDSLAADFENPTGVNAAAVIKVPVSMGNAVDVYAKVAALNLSQPCSIFTTIISTAIMASSTNNPSAMTSAPSEIRCRSIPKTFMAKKVMTSTSGIDNATTKPVRKPKLRNETASTMIMASESELWNK